MEPGPNQGSLLSDDVGRRKYRRSEVFVAGGQPTVTYNPRPGQGFDQRVRDYLDEKHRLLCITGPTKSGKTVLIREVIPDAIRLSGGDMRTIDDFWSDIADALGGFTDESAERTWSDSETDTDRVGAGFKPGGVGVDGDAVKAREKGNEQTRSRSRSRDPRRVAKQELRKTMRPIVLDDFHHVDPDVQREIVRGVKDLVFDGVPVILIAVPHRSMDIVRAEREMRKRVEQLQIKPWTKSELEAIADLGFDALNIACEEKLAQELASEAYGSPQLMQEFCLKICKSNDIAETVPERLDLPHPGDLTPFFRLIAEAEGDDETYRRLLQGPPRTDRKPRRLKGGEETDLYGVVLAGIASTGPKTEIDWTEIKSALRKVMADEPPAKHEYTRALEHMSRIARSLVWDGESRRLIGDPAVEFDPEMDKFHISDPFFAFQLRWMVR